MMQFAQAPPAGDFALFLISRMCLRRLVDHWYGAASHWVRSGCGHLIYMTLAGVSLVPQSRSLPCFRRTPNTLTTQTS